MSLDAPASPFAERVEIARPRHADDRQVEAVVADEAVQRREDLLEGQIARRARRRRTRRTAPRPSGYLPVSRCPPKPKRIAESTLSAKSASPRDEKRA